MQVVDGGSTVISTVADAVVLSLSSPSSYTSTVLQADSSSASSNLFYYFKVVSEKRLILARRYFMGNIAYSVHLWVLSVRRVLPFLAALWKCSVFVETGLF